MEIVNKLLKKVGTDKALHFFVGALFVAWASMLGEYYMYGALVLLLPISVMKEVADDNASFKDVIASILGGSVSIGIYWLMQLILLV